MRQKTRIVVADDHPIFRAGVRTLLNEDSSLQIVGEAQDGAGTIERVRKSRPDLVLLDLSMPGISGLEALETLAKLSHPPRVLLLTTSLQPQQIADAFRLGARGVLLKDAATGSLLKSIRAIMKGQSWLGETVFPDPAAALRSLPPDTSPQGPATTNYGLTPREIQIIAYVAAGLMNKDIAQDLGISDVTVRHHLTSIFNKLGVSNRLELVLFAIDKGLVLQTSRAS